MASLLASLFRFFAPASFWFRLFFLNWLSFRTSFIFSSTCCFSSAHFSLLTLPLHLTAFSRFRLLSISIISACSASFFHFDFGIPHLWLRFSLQFRSCSSSYHPIFASLRPVSFHLVPLLASFTRLFYIVSCHFGYSHLSPRAISTSTVSFLLRISPFSFYFRFLHFGFVLFLWTPLLYFFK